MSKKSIAIVTSSSTDTESKIPARADGSATSTGPAGRATCAGIDASPPSPRQEARPAGVAPTTGDGFGPGIMLALVSSSGGIHRMQFLRASCRSAPPDRPTKRSSAPPTRLDDMSELLTADDMAALLGTTRQAIYSQVARHKLPGVVRLGRKVRFRRTRVVAWVRENSVPSP